MDTATVVSLVVVSEAILVWLTSTPGAASRWSIQFTCPAQTPQALSNQSTAHVQHFAGCVQGSVGSGLSMMSLADPDQHPKGISTDTSCGVLIAGKACVPSGTSTSPDGQD